MTAVYHIGYDTEVPIIDPDHRIDEDCRSFLMQCFIRDPEKRMIHFICCYSIRSIC